MDFLSRVIAIFLLIALLPLLVVITIFSFLIQGRPIFFSQKRVGFSFKHFNILKFRTIKKSNKAENLFKTGNQFEATKWGLLLRITKLDELPQLINIIKGEMRFIGPRPEIPEYVNLELFYFLNKIKPGLSGYSSILFRNESEILSMLDAEDPYDDILRIKTTLDSYYLKKKSFLEDLKLVVITLFSLVIPKTMGHFLLLRMLKVENDTELRLRSIFNDVKLKKIKKSSIQKNQILTNIKHREPSLGLKVKSEIEA